MTQPFENALIYLTRELVNGLQRETDYNFLVKSYYDDTTDETMRELCAALKETANILQQIVKINGDCSQLRELLSDSSLTRCDQDVFAQYWRTKRSQIMHSILTESSGSDTYQRMEWQINMTSNAQEPVAFINMEILMKNEKVQSKVAIEMTNSEIQHLLGELGEIHERISSMC